METIKARDLRAGMWFINPDLASKPATRVMADARPFDETVYEGPHVFLELDDQHKQPYVHSFPADKDLELALEQGAIFEVLFS